MTNKVSMDRILEERGVKQVLDCLDLLVNKRIVSAGFVFERLEFAVQFPNGFTKPDYSTSMRTALFAGQANAQP